MIRLAALVLVSTAAVAAAQPAPPATAPETSVLCAPQVLPAPEEASAHVVGSEEGLTKVALARSDVLYVDRGQADGLEPGSRWLIRQAPRPVIDRKTRRRLGYAIRTIGWGRVDAGNDHRASLRVEGVCDSIMAGDYLAPFEPVPMPSVSLPLSLPAALPTGAQGTLIYAQDDLDDLGSGHFINVDIGGDSGVAAGDWLTIFRVVYPTLDTPPRILGKALVLAVTPTTASAKIMLSVDGITIGDRVAKE